MTEVTCTFLVFKKLRRNSQINRMRQENGCIFHIFISIKFHVVNLSLTFFHVGSLDITPAVLLMLNNFINLYLILSDTFDLKLKYDLFHGPDTISLIRPWISYIRDKLLS